MKSNQIIDIQLNMHNDSNGGDPDTRSKTLNHYHFLLWNKRLPNGELFSLAKIGRTNLYLNFVSKPQTIKLSSDTIFHTYSTWKSMKHITDKIHPKYIKEFLDLGSTIAGFMIFPAYRVERKPTINAIRGMHTKIKDRFDLTLECIRKWYIREDSPLYEDIERYKHFFQLFIDFKGYVDFFLLNDLVDDNYQIKFWLPFETFDISNPLPTNVDSYMLYMNNLTNFLKKRSERILTWSKTYL